MCIAPILWDWNALVSAFDMSTEWQKAIVRVLAARCSQLPAMRGAGSEQGFLGLEVYS